MIVADQGVPPKSTSPLANRKMFEKNVISHFVLTLLGSSLQLLIDFFTKCAIFQWCQLHWWATSELALMG
jgi:hypothetical protein